ncbi:DUF3418 domain-containing protein [Micrococcus luteus]
MRIPNWRLPVVLLAASLALSAGPLIHPTPSAAAVLAGPNLAAGKAASASSSTQTYAPANVTDGNQGTYWESANNAFPQWVQVDLGSSVATNQVVLRLPTSGWGARNQTLAVQGSTDGQNFSDLSASAVRAFNPPSNAVTIDYGTATTRFVRIRITGNTGWPAGQLSELEVYGPATGDTQAPTAPGGLAFTEPGAGQIRLTWNASTDNVGVTGYDVYANGQLRTSVAGNVVSYTDNQPGSTSISYFVRAKDAAGNQSPNSNTVTRNGSSGPGSNLALGKPIDASGYVHIFADCTQAAVDRLVGDELPFDEAAFRALFDRVRADLIDTVFAVTSLVEQVLSRAAQVRRRLKDSVSLALAPALSDVKAHLEQLVFPGFVAATGWERLQHLPRYLQGMLTRLDRLDAGGHLQRDGQHMAVVQGLEDEFDAAVAAHRARFAGTPVPAELERVRWLIEELRVSFFAQELGTAVSVSEKRVRQALARATRA